MASLFFEYNKPETFCNLLLWLCARPAAVVVVR